MEKDHGNTKSAGKMGQKPFARTFPTEEELESRADEPLAAFERKEHVVREKLVEVESVKVRARRQTRKVKVSSLHPRLTRNESPTSPNTAAS